MNVQTDLLEAWAARDRAIQQVALHAPKDWLGAARKAVFEVACVREYLTSDDVREFLQLGEVEAPKEMRALGPVMLYAAREGWIEATGRVVRPAHKASHMRPKAVWRSLISKELP